MGPSRKPTTHAVAIPLTMTPGREREEGTAPLQSAASPTWMDLTGGHAPPSLHAHRQRRGVVAATANDDSGFTDGAEWSAGRYLRVPSGGTTGREAPGARGSCLVGRVGGSRGCTRRSSRTICPCFAAFRHSSRMPTPVCKQDAVVASRTRRPAHRPQSWPLPLALSPPLPLVQRGDSGERLQRFLLPRRHAQPASDAG